MVSAYDVEIRGAEFEASAALIERLRLGGALAYARSEMNQGLFNTVTPSTGSNDIKGNANPRFPEWSGSVNAEYEAPLNDDWRRRPEHLPDRDCRAAAAAAARVARVLEV